jgi:murein DD-endopeptidase MepM/ murein hydrolase activator NlpD
MATQRRRRWLVVAALLVSVPINVAFIVLVGPVLWRGLHRRSPAPTRFGDYQTKTELHLPFEGEWEVFWGGRTSAQNAHVSCSDQRFAYDFDAVRGGRSRDFSWSSTNEDFYAFGRPILAPADAVVVEAVDSLPDNEPGKMDPKHPAGNHVILDFMNGEYALLAHFRQGSLRARAGDRVEHGQVLASCGNSGNTSQPHLHFHLQNSPKLDPCGKVEGLPAFFVDYTADGRRVARGEPIRGQIVRRDGPKAR